VVKRLLAIILVLALWPALGELIELAAHAVEHGDLAHADDDEHDAAPLGEDEHGCSGSFHLCPCHHPSPVVNSTVAAAVESEATSALSAHLAPAIEVGVGLAAPPTRPPIV